MTNFSLATIAAEAGPASALVIEGRTHRLSTLDPDLGAHDVKALLAAWDVTLPRLKVLAETAPRGGGTATARCA